MGENKAVGPNIDFSIAVSRHALICALAQELASTPLAKNLSARAQLRTSLERSVPSSSLSAAADIFFECDPRNSVNPRSGITILDPGVAEEVGMTKSIGIALVALAVLAQPAPSHAGTNARLHPAGAQKDKPTPPPRSSYVSCKKYFPLIGAIVSVPCSG